VFLVSGLALGFALLTAGLASFRVGKSFFHVELLLSGREDELAVTVVAKHLFVNKF
jgi:hypothetical protein